MPWIRPGAAAVSFSRSRGWLATAWLDGASVADGWRIGVDIEEHSAFATPDDLGAVGYSTAEAAAIARLSASDQPVARARLWSVKEALVKARGTGFRSDPAEVSTAPLRELEALLPPAKVEYVEKQPTLEDVFLAIVGTDSRPTSQ